MIVSVFKLEDENRRTKIVIAKDMGHAVRVAHMDSFNYVSCTRVFSDVVLDGMLYGIQNEMEEKS